MFGRSSQVFSWSLCYRWARTRSCTSRVYTGAKLNDTQSALATAYRTLFAVLGSYLTARLAPNKPMKHALIGASIGTLIATAGTVATWNRDLGPHWYPVALILTAFPTAWIGAKIWLAQTAKP